MRLPHLQFMRLASLRTRRRRLAALAPLALPAPPLRPSAPLRILSPLSAGRRTVRFRTAGAATARPHPSALGVSLLPASALRWAAALMMMLTLPCQRPLAAVADSARRLPFRRQRRGIISALPRTVQSAATATCWICAQSRLIIKSPRQGPFMRRRTCRRMAFLLPLTL